MPVSTFTVLEDIAADVPEIIGLINAIEGSIAAHKGEDAVDTGLDILADCIPALKALYKAVAAQIQAATPPAAP